ncbi:MAG: homoserine dehydrogenase [Clostridia bacterium]|nr:homoserine dehydrogenase [Clostridia bacterium]
MKAAILGFGVVGSGTYEVLSKSPVKVDVKRILDIRHDPLVADKLTTDINDILNDPEIELVAETMGGLHPAYEYVTAAMKAGKNVVTSNKKLVATYYAELISLAEEKGVSFRFTPSAGGGIPWLSNIVHRACTEKILKVQGIINGTTNFILDSMQSRGADFSEVLAEAQDLGYAERDPSSDIDGEDVKFKCALSASCAFGVQVSESDIPTFSLRNIKKDDMAYASKMGMNVKYMAFAANKGEGAFSAYVEPVFVPNNCLEASVHLNNNFVSLFGEYSGRLSFFGQGAGKYPTGASVATDMIAIFKGKNFPVICKGNGIVKNGEEFHRYYIRTTEKLAALCGLVETCEEKNGVFYIVTREISVESMHKFADEIRKRDADVFFAGIHPEV